MPTPSSLPQRSRTAPLSRRSSSPRWRSPLHIGPSPQHLLSPFRMNTCKSVSKQRTLTIFRMNTYAKTGGGGTPGYPHTLYQSNSATIDLLLLCFHILMSCFFRKYFCFITICVAPCVFALRSVLNSLFCRFRRGSASRQSEATRDVFHTSSRVYPERSRGAFATFRNPCYLPHHQGDFKCQ
jgi:hypothetical protein